MADAYVAAMKGVILGINPEAKLVDICHTIKPQHISQAAFVLSTVYRFFPERTIHVVVVDPGVGTKRRAIILRAPLADFIAPDNGVLSYVIRDFGEITPAEQPELVELPNGLEAVAITRPEFWRSPVSATFHGRDIFAPVAARLSLGVPPADFGEAIRTVTVIPLAYPYKTRANMLVGQIIHIDHFGNLITNIKSDDLPQAKQAITVEVGGRSISGLRLTYEESGGLLALIGSSGYLEISLRGDAASDFLHAEVGDKVKIRLENQ